MINSFAWYWQLPLRAIAFFLAKQWGGEEAVRALTTAANILIGCGVIGGLTALLFCLRRHVKILALLLILWGVAPLMFDTKPFGFAGLPMILGGFIGLFVRGKQRVSGQNKV
jgi:hypothetical protein